MSKQLKISIPTPCHEKWENMTPVEKGKFCGSCQKQVVDFSKMSDREVAMFFKKPILSQSKDGSVCGRFMKDQLDREIEIPKKRIPWLKYFFQFLLPAYLISCTNNRTIGKVQASEPKTETVDEGCGAAMGMIETEPVQLSDTTRGSVFDSFKMVDGYVDLDTLSLPDTVVGDIDVTIINDKQELKEIKGKVVDEKNDPIPDASIIIKGTNTVTLSDTAGKFNLGIQKQDTLIILSASAIGYDSKEIAVASGNFSDTTEIILKRQEMWVGEAIIARTNDEKKTKKEIKPIPLTQQSFEYDINRDLKIFPDPVRSGSILNIEFKQPEEGEYMLQFFNQSGQLVFNKAMWIDKDARVVNLEAPHVVAGNYFIRMINKHSGKLYTEKIIIE